MQQSEAEVQGEAGGDREGRKIQGMYPDEDAGQYSIHCSKLPTTRPLALRLLY